MQGVIRPIKLERVGACRYGGPPTANAARSHRAAVTQASQQRYHIGRGLLAVSAEVGPRLHELMALDVAVLIGALERVTLGPGRHNSTILGAFNSVLLCGPKITQMGPSASPAIRLGTIL